jgi:hypothetical protein
VYFQDGYKLISAAHLVASPKSREKMSSKLRQKLRRLDKRLPAEYPGGACLTTCEFFERSVSNLSRPSLLGADGKSE